VRILHPIQHQQQSRLGKRVEHIVQRNVALA